MNDHEIISARAECNLRVKNIRLFNFVIHKNRIIYVGNLSVLFVPIDRTF